jgi:hypothetical protein
MAPERLTRLGLRPVTRQPESAYGLAPLVGRTSRRREAIMNITVTIAIDIQPPVSKVPSEAGTAAATR